MDEEEDLDKLEREGERSWSLQWLCLQLLHCLPRTEPCKYV